MPDAKRAHETLRPQRRSRPRQDIDFNQKLGVKDGKNKRGRDAAKPQVRERGY
jgi:hypothetical protein